MLPQQIIDFFTYGTWVARIKFAKGKIFWVVFIVCYNTTGQFGHWKTIKSILLESCHKVLQVVNPFHDGNDTGVEGFTRIGVIIKVIHQSVVLIC